MSPLTIASLSSAGSLLCAAAAVALAFGPATRSAAGLGAAAVLGIAAVILASLAYRLARPRAAAPPGRVEELSRQLDECHALYNIAQALGSGLGVPETMTRLAGRLDALVPLSSCALFLSEDDGGTIRCRFATGVDADRIQQLTMRNGQWTAGWAEGAPRPPGADPPATAGDAEVRTVLASALMCPFIFDNQFVGMLAVYHTEPGAYTDDHRRLLTLVAEQAAAVLHHSLVFERTQEDALRDPLTGLLNARYVIMHLSRELVRAERLGTPVSLLVLDLDRFKEINDRCGHHVGDLALRAVGAALQSVIRRYDVCVRYAGDEFIVVLSGCGIEEAEKKQADLQQVIARTPFEGRPGEQLQLEISVGLAVYPRDGASFEELLAAADARMYEDKARRR